MNPDFSKKSISDRVISAIKSGEVKMRPRWHFVLRAILLILGAVIAGLAIIYLVSLIIFTTRQTGAGFVPIFGPRGWFAFLRSLPWLLVALSLLFIGVLEILVRRYAFSYRRPILVSVGAILVIVSVGGLAVAHTVFHRQLLRYAEQHEIPIVGSWYRGIREQQFSDIHPGTIVATTTYGFEMQSRRGETFTVMIGPRTRLPFGADFNPGEMVVVFGDSDPRDPGATTTAVQAFGIREIGE